MKLKVSIIILVGLLILFLLLNAYTIKTVNKNVIQLLFENNEQIEENTKKENIIIEKEAVITSVGNTQNELEMDFIKIDNEKLIVKYILSIKNEKNKKLDNTNINIIDQPKLEIEKRIYDLQEYSSISINEIDNKKYEIYCTYEVKGIELNKETKFMSWIDISEINYDDTISEDLIIGRWNVEKNITEFNYTQVDKTYYLNKEINVNTLDLEDNSYGSGNLQVLRVKELENNISLMVILTGYTTEPGITYGVKVFDEDGKNLLVGTPRIIGGCVTEILLNKFSLDSKISIVLLENDGFGDYSIKRGEGKSDIILSNLIEEVEIEKPSYDTYYWRGLELEYNANSWEVDRSSTDVFRTVNNTDEVRYYKSISIKDNINGYIVYTDHIDMSIYSNIMEMDLNEIYTVTSKLMESGSGYRINSQYTTYIEMKGEDAVECTLNHKQMMDVLDGKSVVVSGIEITKDIISGGITNIKIKNKEKTKIDGIDAITFIRDNGETERYYMFLKDNMIYEIKVPERIDLKEEVDRFINNIIVE